MKAKISLIKETKSLKVLTIAEKQTLKGKGEWISQYVADCSVTSRDD